MRRQTQHIASAVFGVIAAMLVLIIAAGRAGAAPLPPAPPTAAPTPSNPAAFPGLGTAGQYAVLSLSTTYQNQSLVTIYGDVGIGPNGKAVTQAPSTVYGRVYRDPTAAYSNKGHVTGSPPVVVKSMSQEVADATNASSFYASQLPTQTFSNINMGMTINGNPGFNYIKLTGGIALGGSNNLTLNGSASSYFVFNISGGLSLTGNSSIVLTGGVDPSHVLFNFIGAGSALSTHVGNTIRGTILAISRSISFDGVFIGEIIGGGPNLTLLSGAIVRNPNPPSVPDAASTLVLGLIGLIALIGFRSLCMARPVRDRKTV